MRFQIPADNGVIATIAWLVFLTVFSVAWVYFGIRFVWWEMLIMLRCDNEMAQRSKARFYAAVMVIATLVYIGARMFLIMRPR